MNYYFFEKFNKLMVKSGGIYKGIIKNNNCALKISLEKQKYLVKDFIKLLCKWSLIESNSEGKRILNQNGFKINNKTIKDFNTVIEFFTNDQIKFGKIYMIIKSFENIKFNKCKNVEIISVNLKL